MCPCGDCARGIIQSGCRMVITKDINSLELDTETIARWTAEWNISIMMMQEVGITLMFLTKDDLSEN